MIEKLKAWANKVWEWCKESATIVVARLHYVVGIIGAGLIAAFAGYDWSQLASMDLKTAFKLLVLAAVSGIMTEWARRRTLPKE